MFFTILATLTAYVVADGTYRSRPDLAPPHLNITTQCQGRCEKGFLFIAPFTGFDAPYDHGPLQAAPYIMQDDGELVWSGFTYFSTWAGNFQAARWEGQDILFSFEGAHNSLHGHGHGHHTFLDQHYQPIRELRAGNHMLSDKHEFIIVDEKTALFQIYHPMQMDLGPYGGNPEQSWIVDARFQEMDIRTGEVLFEWRSLDHALPNETSLPLTLGQAGTGHNSSTAWDYFHINSIAKGEDGHYLLSARHASTILKINGTDGSVIWRLGGNKSDFTLGPNVSFGFQHHARYMSGGNESVDFISFFDNSAYGSESAGGGDKEVRLFPFSRGKYVQLDHVKKTATLMQAFHPPQDSILTKSQGSLQILPNENALINWGSEGQITEYNSKGTPVFHAFLDSGMLQENLQNYRAFRYNWTGFSPETSAIVAESYNERETKVYVSWSGDTEAAMWRFSWTFTSDASKIVQTGQVERTGFETEFTIIGPVAQLSSIYAQAIDKSGRILTTSEKVGTVDARWRLGHNDELSVTGNGQTVLQSLGEL